GHRNDHGDLKANLPPPPLVRRNQPDFWSFLLKRLGIRLLRRRLGARRGSHSHQRNRGHRGNQYHSAKHDVLLFLFSNRSVLVSDLTKLSDSRTDRGTSFSQNISP